MQYEQKKDESRLNEAASLMEQAINDCRRGLASRPEDRLSLIQLVGGLQQYAKILRHKGLGADADRAEGEAKNLSAALGLSKPVE